MMSIVELNYKSSDEAKARYVKAHTMIWNHSDNLKFLSFTGQLFTTEMLNQWIFGLNEHSEMKYFTAIEDDQIVGIIVVRASLINGYEIGGLGVFTDWKNKGIGSRLVDRAIEDAKGNGYKAIETVVYVDNILMLILTIKKGFQPCRINVDQRYDGMNTVSLKKHFQTMRN